MAITYRPPGVVVTETIKSVIEAEVGDVVVCVVGTVVGYQEVVETISFDGTAGISLSNKGVITDSTAASYIFSLFNPLSGTTYVRGTNYSLSTVSNVTTVNRDGTAIPDNVDLRVTYRYENNTLYDTYQFDDLGDVLSFYGDALNDGVVVSELSLAAKLAWESGARTLITKAVDNGDWESAITELQDEEYDVLLPVGATSTEDALLKSNAYYMREQGRPVFTLVSLESDEGLSDAKSRAAVIDHEYIAVLYPESVDYYDGVSNIIVSLPGWALASEIAGIMTRQQPQETLTRVGIQNFELVPKLAEPTKNDIAASGVIVVENMGGINRIRHALTTDMSNAVVSELNVVLAKLVFIKFIKNFTDTNVIGMEVYDDTLPILVGIYDGLLQEAKEQRLIFGYRNLTVDFSNNIPVELNVKFAYRPVFSITYVDIGIEINTQNWNVNVTTA